ncbi:MAG: response regulator transcription factor [Vallitaleaceae bacterium]|nr:response regulator transcription factor [Vallitaleaceae bacterium]
MISILIADDQTLFRSMLETVLQSDGEFNVIASLDNGRQAVDAVEKLNPDLVLLDIQMPIMSGIEALAEIKRFNTAIKVVLLTTFEDVDQITTASQLGMDGYLMKDMRPEILTMALKCIYHDLILINKSVFEVMCPRSGSLNSLGDEKVTFGDITFEKTELMIIRQIAEGRSNKEIARILNYSEGTIKNKVSSILSATGLGDRGQIALFALRNNII